MRWGVDASPRRAAATGRRRARRGGGGRVVIGGDDGVNAGVLVVLGVVAVVRDVREIVFRVVVFDGGGARGGFGESRGRLARRRRASRAASGGRFERPRDGSRARTGESARVETESETRALLNDVFSGR